MTATFKGRESVHNNYAPYMNRIENLHLIFFSQVQSTQSDSSLCWFSHLIGGCIGLIMFLNLLLFKTLFRIP
jgi:hypothetical protein